MAKRKSSKQPQETWLDHSADSMKTLSTWLIGSDRWAKLTRFILLAGIVVSGSAFGLHRLDQYVREHPTLTSSKVEVSFIDQPGWMSKALAIEILENAKSPIQDQLIAAHRAGNDELLPKLFYDQLQASGWVSQVDWVRRFQTGQLLVKCTFNEPIAVAAIGKWRYLVSAQGTLLPGRYTAEVIGPCGLMEIRGVAGQPPMAGMEWRSEDVVSALALVKALGEKPYRSQVKAIDVTNYNGRVSRTECWIDLVTARDTQIKWGRPIGLERGLEIPARSKFTALKAGLESFGYIDFGRASADVRHAADNVYVSQAPAPAEP